MYRLENNIEWTPELKDAFKHGITRAKIIYNDTEINEENNLCDLTLDEQRYITNLGFIGSATARKLELNLIDLSGNINLENKEVTLKIGAEYEGETYYINYGNFIVDKAPENDATDGKIRVVAYDYMIKFNKMYESKVIYPCTLLQLLQDVCNQAEVELGQENFANNSFIVEDNQFEGATLREVLQNIAKCAFSWARIGQDNKLYLDFSLSAQNVENITIDEYKYNSFKTANEYYGPINQVTYADSTIEGQEERVKDQASIDEYGIKELVIYDNLFAYTPEKRAQLIQAGRNLLGLKYMPISQLELIGLAYLDCRDKIQIGTLEENVFESRVFNHSIRYTGALSDSIVNEATSDNQEIYKNTANDVFQNQQTKIVVDKAKKQIQSVIEDINKQNSKISQITQTVNELNSKISDIADITISQESINAKVEFKDINESEPITVRIHPISTNISLLYPRTNLYPSPNLFMTTRTIRFINLSEYQITQDKKYTSYKKYYSYNEETYTLLEVGTDYEVNQIITGDVYENEYIDYKLPMNLLWYDENNYDEFLLDYDSETCQITKKVKYNADGTTSLLDEETVYTFEYPKINLKSGDYEVKLLGYKSAYIYVRLMSQNIYTTQFTTKSEMRTSIDQTANSIISTVSQTYETKNNAQTNYSRITQNVNNVSIEVGKKYNTSDFTNAKIVAAINDGTSEAQIKAEKVSLAGKTIDMTSDNININSTNFKVDKNGNVNCSNIKATNGTFTGDLYMSANKKLASTSQGIMSTLFAEGTGPFNGYEFLGYGLSLDGKYQRTSPMVGIYIPNNFTPVYAYLFMEQVQPKFKLNTGTVTGRASSTKIRKGNSGPSFELLGFASEYFMNMNAISGTDITRAAFGANVISPNLGMSISGNIASQLTKGQLNVFSAYITDGSYDNMEATFEGNEQAAIGRITGLVKMSIQVIGYLNPF